MSLSDCVKCWDTPCTCGWGYKNYSIEALEKRIKLFEKIIKFKKQFPDANFSGYMIIVDEKGTKDDRKLMEFINGQKTKVQSSK